MALGLVCTEFNGQSLLVDTESGECVFMLQIIIMVHQKKSVNQKPRIFLTIWVLVAIVMNLSKNG